MAFQLMDIDLNRMWKETTMQFFKAYSRHLPGNENCAHAEIKTRISVMNVRSFKA
jgi:hypothetical protein